MSDSSRSMQVLKKIMQKKTKAIGTETKEISEQLVSSFWQEEEAVTKTFKKKRPGRPVVKEEKKARNFTLCMGPKYIDFLDQFKVPQKKLMGRGRKVRFIIDEFIVLYKRQKSQLELLVDVLNQVEAILKKHSGKVRKNEKLQLTPSEKGEITQYVQHVNTLQKVLGFSPKELHKLLAKDKWAVMAFCMDWSQKQGLQK